MALVKIPNGSLLLVRLKLIFTCVAADQTEYHLARVSTFKTISEGKNNVIGMRAVKEQDEYRFIRLDWIL